MEDYLLIAKFMNQEVDAAGYIREKLHNHISKQVVSHASAYTRSWEMLIPVVEKICSFRNEDNQAIYTIETSFRGGVNLRVRFCDEDNDPTAHYSDETTFKALYSAVVDFIKWYNDNK